MIRAPSINQRYARSRGESYSPRLWDDLALYVDTRLGVQGSTLRDLSGRGNDGVLTAAPPWQTEQGGWALSLDGISQLIDFGNKEALYLPGKFSIGCRFKVTGGASATTRTICSDLDAATGGNWSIELVVTTTELARFGWGWAFNQGVTVSSISAVSDSKWHWAHGVFDGANNLIYIDGRLENTATVAGHVRWNAGENFAIGRLGSYSALYFPGFISTLGLWNRDLSAQEILEMANEVVSPLSVRRRRVITGDVGGIPAGFILDCESGNFAYAGTAANLIWSYTILPNTALTLNRNNATFQDWRGWPASMLDFTVTVAPIVFDISGSGASVVTIKDADYNTSTDAVVETGAIITTSTFCTFECLDPSIATVDQNGLVNWVSNGTARIRVSSGKTAKMVLVSVSRTGGQTYSTFLNYTAGTLARAFCDVVDNAIAVTDTYEGIRVWDVQDHVNNTYVRNPHSLPGKNGWDITALSPCNTQQLNGKKGFTLVHPRIAQCAWHYEQVGSIIGYKVRFVTNDNIVHERTVINTRRVLPSSIVSDTAYALFDSPFPAEIKIAKVLPTTFRVKLPTVIVAGGQPANPVTGIPVFITNQYNYGSVHEWSQDVNPSTVFLVPSENTNPARAAYFIGLVQGDSGRSWNLIDPVDKSCIVLTPAWGPTYGTSTMNPDTDLRAANNAAMNFLLAGASLTEANISAWPSF